MFIVCFVCLFYFKGLRLITCSSFTFSSSFFLFTYLVLEVFTESCWLFTESCWLFTESCWLFTESCWLFTVICSDQFLLVARKTKTFGCVGTHSLNANQFKSIVCFYKNMFVCFFFVVLLSRIGPPAVTLTQAAAFRDGHSLIFRFRLILEKLSV